MANPSPLLPRGALLAGFALSACSASAATLVQYGLNNTFNAATTPAGIAASAIAYNTTLNAGAFSTTAISGGTEGSHWYRINGVDLTNASLTKPSLAVSSGALNHYFEFTVTPDSGYQYDLSSLSVIAIGSDTNAAYANLTAFITVQYRVGATGSFLSLGTQSTDNNDAVSSGTAIARDLSFALASSTITEATTFRIYINDQSGGGTAGNLGLDNVRLEGSLSAIPEPASAAVLAGAAALGLVACRRRRST